VDVTVVNPALPSRTRVLGEHDTDADPVEAGYAAKVAEGLKENKYQALGVPMNSFTAFVVEATGRLGKKAETLLDAICPEDDGEGNACRNRSRDFFFRRLACAIQSQNAEMVRHYRNNTHHLLS